MASRTVNAGKKGSGAVNATDVILITMPDGDGTAVSNSGSMAIPSIYFLPITKITVWTFHPISALLALTGMTVFPVWLPWLSSGSSVPGFPLKISSLTQHMITTDLSFVR